MRLIKKAEETAANSTNTASSSTSSSTAQQSGGAGKGSQADKDRPERLKMKLSKRKSEMQNGTPEGTAVLRQPKGPEAQGAKGFGRQRLPDSGGVNGDTGTAPGSDDNTATPAAAAAAAATTEQQQQQVEADQSA